MSTFCCNKSRLLMNVRLLKRWFTLQSVLIDAQFLSVNDNWWVPFWTWGNERICICLTLLRPLAPLPTSLKLIKYHGCKILFIRKHWIVFSEREDPRKLILLMHLNRLLSNNSMGDVTSFHHTRVFVCVCLFDYFGLRSAQLNTDEFDLHKVIYEITSCLRFRCCSLFC